MPVNAFGYNRPRWGLHFCPWDAECVRDQTYEWDGVKSTVMPWLYIHTPWGSLIIPFTLDRGNWPAQGWWLSHKIKR
jgi:hypothetical protein